MTREQARKNLETIGIENPTDEQITNYLNQVQGETRFERERADKLKDKASKADELQQQIDEMQSANQTDNEKLQTALDKANGQIASLQKDIARTKLLNNLASKGITGDDAEKLVSEDGTLDIEILGKIISDRETSAAANKEKELLNGTPNPNGGKGGSDDGKTSAEKMVEKLFPKQEQGNNSIVNQYINNGGN